jgi:hypothetical protein
MIHNLKPWLRCKYPYELSKSVFYLNSLDFNATLFIVLFNNIIAINVKEWLNKCQALIKLLEFGPFKEGENIILL